MFLLVRPLKSPPFFWSGIPILCFDDKHPSKRIENKQTKNRNCFVLISVFIGFFFRFKKQQQTKNNRICSLPFPSLLSYREFVYVCACIVRLFEFTEFTVKAKQTTKTKKSINSKPRASFCKRIPKSNANHFIWFITYYYLSVGK